MKKYFSFTLIILIFSWCNSFSQGEVGPQPQVFQDVYHDTSPPLRDLVGSQVTQTQWEDGIVPLLIAPPRFEDQYEKDPALQLFNGINDLGIIVQNFDGIPVGTGGMFVAPPDPSGDVGPNHYVQLVNFGFQVWNKTGTSLLGPLTLGTIWAGFPGPWASALNSGDPIVLYDEAADRWLVSEFSLPNGGSGPEYMLIAISQTNNPTGAWHRYAFQFTNMPDYPKFGVWPDGYYMSANSFSGGFIGAIAVAFERSQMLNGLPAQMVSFQNSSATTWSLLPADNDGAAPPGSAPNYFTQIHDNARYGGSDGLDVFQFTVNWVTPGSSTFTGPTFIPTSPYNGVSGIPQPPPGEVLQDLSVMTMNRLNYRNFGSHQSMVVCHTIEVSGGRAGMRWYELQNTGGGWSLFQEGTYGPADGLHRWMGSVAINSNGDMCLGYSVSSSAIFPEIRFTGRLSSDPLGTMPITEEIIFASSGVQVSTFNRWGDYTQMTVDPAEPDVFWYTNQYIPSTGSFNWRTRIASIDFALVPVELTSFSAAATNDEVELNWSTATEINNQGFEVQRKSANSEFEKVGYVAGFGTTTEPKSYSFIEVELPAGNYIYRLKQIDFNGKFEYTDEVNVDVTAPIEYALEQNHPNPFNPSTMIKYSIAEDGFVKLAVYNLTGEEVALLVNSQQKAGRYEIDFNASNLASGVYIYRMESANFITSKKLMLMK